MLEGVMTVLLLLLSQTLEPLRSYGHEFRNAREVPVRIGDLGMPEIGRQGEDLLLPDIGSLVIPAQEFAHRKCMTTVMKSRPPCAPLSAPTQATPNPGERLLHGCRRKL
jgi:hypothetical protein